MRFVTYVEIPIIVAQSVLSSNLLEIFCNHKLSDGENVRLREMLEVLVTNFIRDRCVFSENLVLLYLTPT